MKKSLIISLLLLTVCQLFAQSQYLYSGGKTVVGKNVKYLCKSRVGFPNYIRIDNVNNRDTTLNIYHTDGTLLDEFEEIVAAYNFRELDIYKVIELVFTRNELELLKDNNTFIEVYFTTDADGIATEISFGFMKNTMVLSTFDPDRFYELENKLKEIIELDIDKSQKLRNPKGSYEIEFENIP